MKTIAVYLGIGIMLFGAFLFENRTKSPEKSKPEKSKKDIKINNIKEYYVARDSIAKQKKIISLQYTRAKSASAKNIVLNKGRDLFLSGLTRNLFPAWYGTRWEFYGYGDTPRVNPIACGYFVSILLRDIGANVDINKLAEGTSGAMIKKLVTPDYIKSYRNVAPQQFFDAVKKDGDGLYIIGLDNHTGFLLCESGKLYFIESVPNDVVRRRTASESGWLTGSQFRMSGKISDDPNFLRKWLIGERF
jgi:hypothetical protein